MQKTVFSQTADSVKVELLNEVTVRYIQDRQRSLTPSQSLKGRTLENLNSLTVADAVRYFSGVQLKDYGGIGGLKTIDTRGMGSHHTAVFYDGIQLGNAQNGQVDMGKFSLENIEEVSLFNAHRSNLLQPARSYASATSVYLQSKTPAFTEDKKYNVLAKVKGGSFGLFNPSLLWEQKINNRLAASVSSEWINANGKYKFRYTNGVYDTTAYRENADINAYRVEAGIYGSLKDSAEWRVKLYYYHSERGLPGAVVANKFARGQRQYDDNFFLQTSYKSDPLKKYRYLVNAKFANDYMRYVDSEMITTDGALDNRYTQQEIYLSFANQYSINNRWEVAAAIDAQYNSLDANIYRFSYPTRYQLSGVLSTQINVQRFILQGGALQTWVRDKVKLYEDAGNKNEFTPYVAGSWQPFLNNNFKLRGFYKNIFRLPTFNDLYYTFIGNVNLRPEYVHQYDIGFSWTKPLNGIFRYLSVDADFYYNSVTDKIVAVPTTNLYRWMMINLDKVDIRGIDVHVDHSLTLPSLLLNTSIKYSYQRARDKTEGAENFNHQVPYIPLNSGSVVCNASWEDFIFNYSFIYNGYRYNQKMNTLLNYIQPWYTHDISLGKQWFYKQKTLKLLLEVNNLFNQYFDVVINFPMPGRYYRASLSVKI